MSQRGVTLIELLVTIAVLAIIATIAVPGFQSMMANNRLASNYNEVLISFYYARSEAVKRHRLVTADIDRDVSGVWAVEVSYQEEGQSKVVLSRRARDGRVAVSENAVSFNSLGRRADCHLTDGECRISVGDEVIVVEPSGRIHRGG
jgi:type IV fimbrial biogenesis protein FimT